MRIRLIAVLLALCALLGCTAGAAKKKDKTANNSASDIPAMPEGEPLEPGRTVTIDDVSEFSVESVAFKDDIRPQNPDTYYMYIPSDEGKIFVDVCFLYRNLRSENVKAAQQFTAELFASGQYLYEGRIRPEKGDRSEVSSFDSMQVVPLGTAYIHCVFEIPEALKDDACELIAFITVEGRTTYSVAVREGGKGALDFASKDCTEKPSGAIAVGEGVLLPDVCTFRIETAQIAEEVRPPQHADFQTYFKADEGMVYVDVCTSYMNLKHKETATRDTVSAQMTYAGKYNYKCITVLESADGEKLTQNNFVFVSPLCTERVHYLFEVPAEIAGSGESIVVTFKVGPNEYRLTVR